MSLQALGLISICEKNDNINYVISEAKGLLRFTYGTQCFQFIEGCENIKLGFVVFTKAGQELSRIIECELIPGFFDEIVSPLWMEQFLMKEEVQ